MAVTLSTSAAGLHVRALLHVSAEPLEDLRRALPAFAATLKSRQAAIGRLSLDGGSVELVGALGGGGLTSGCREGGADGREREFAGAGGFSPLSRWAEGLNGTLPEAPVLAPGILGPSGCKDSLVFSVRIQDATLSVVFHREEVFNESEVQWADTLRRCVVERFGPFGGGDRFRQAWRLPFTDTGRFVFLPGGAEKLLRCYFGPVAGEPEQWPPALLQWVRAARRKRDHGHAGIQVGEASVDRPQGRLHVRLEAAKDGWPEALSLFEEKGRHNFFQLGQLRLTLRECEVLFWVAQGKVDADIAVILGMAPKTVGKHVENILLKLGANNRTAAAVRAVDWLADQCI